MAISKERSKNLHKENQKTLLDKIVYSSIQIRFQLNQVPYFAEDIPVMESRELDLTK